MSVSVSEIWIAQLNPTVGDIAGNVERMLGSIQQAKAAGAAVVVFPELAVCGYPPKDMLLYPAFVDACLQADAQIQATATDGLTIIWGNSARNPNPKGKPLINVANVAQHGQIIGRSIKTHLPTYDVFDEARYFEPGQADSSLFKASLSNGETVAVCVCEDIWSHPALSHDEKRLITPIDYPTPVFPTSNTKLNTSLLINLSASPYLAGKPQLRLDLLKRIAAHEQTTVIYANQVGAHDDIIFDGHSSVTYCDGQQDVWTGFSTQSRLSQVDSHSPHRLLEKPEEQRQAIILGIRDYFRKTGFQRALIGLSGGVDSALVAALACQALGRDNIEGVMMPGPYSSPDSLTDALDLADNLGIAVRQIAINPLFDPAISLLNPNGERLHDLAEQNLQARLRGLVLMTLSNRENKLLLATSNKSELAMGYSTLYGDSCGALAPIGDLYKTEVYALCQHLNQMFGQHSAYIPDSILNKAPSAELAPNQKDEDSLGPYAELDPKLKAILEQQNASPDERTFAQVMRQEFKRQQGPVILKLSPTAFGSGRQFLIAQASAWTHSKQKSVN